MRPAHVFAKPSTDAELGRIVGLLHGPWRFALRLVMIWLSARGLPASEIAALFEYDPHTVRRWIDRYNQEGVAGLEDRPRSGAPRLGSARLGRRIRILLREPRAWTVGQLRRALGYPAMSLATLARRVREQASWRRPRLVAKGHPHEAAVLAALHEEIAALPEGAVILAEDEAPRQPAALAPLDLDRQGRAAGGDDAGQEREAQYLRRHRAGHRALAVPHRRARHQRRLHRVPGAGPRRLPQGAGDCHRARQRGTHSSRAVEGWLAAHARVKLLYGARYSPHHNPVERVWGAMKRHLANSPTLTMLGRIQEVHAYFRAHSRAQMVATASPFNTRWLPPGYGQKLWKAASLDLSIRSSLWSATLSVSTAALPQVDDCAAAAKVPKAISAAVNVDKLLVSDAALAATLTDEMMTLLKDARCDVSTYKEWLGAE